MSKHLTGSKRLQVIQNWLNGRDDPEWDVLPTKKENKYIVKRRTEPLSKPQAEPQVEEQEVEEPAEEPTKPLPTCSQGKVCSAKKIERTKPQSNIYSHSEVGYANDPTINMEILNQLKLLGEEIKNKREKKEQKRMIKEVVQKQMSKPYYQYTQPQYIQEPNLTSGKVDFVNDIEEEPEEELPPTLPPQPQIIRRRRNNIFSDML